MHRLLRTALIFQHVLQRALKVLEDITKVFLFLLFIRSSAGAWGNFGARSGIVLILSSGQWSWALWLHLGN